MAFGNLNRSLINEMRHLNWNFRFLKSSAGKYIFGNELEERVFHNWDEVSDFIEIGLA